MPKYAYECGNCGEIEISHSIKDDEWTECPVCKGAIKRFISSEAGQNFILKGDGFHQNDYGRKKKDVNHPSVSRDERIGRRHSAKKVIKKHIDSTKGKRYH